MTERMTAADFQKQAKKRKWSDPERQIHIDILAHLQAKLPGCVINHASLDFFVSVNGGPEVQSAVKMALKRAVAKLKHMGARKGWPDIEVLYQGQFMTFEVKTESGKLTEEQTLCGLDIRAQGGKWAVVRSVQDVDECLAEWASEGVTEIELRGQVR